MKIAKTSGPFQSKTQSRPSRSSFAFSGESLRTAEVEEALARLERRIAYRAIKRTFDIAFSLFVLIAFWWLFAAISIAIKLDNPSGPVIFKQTRVGKDGVCFEMYKFRSMHVDAEKRLDCLRELNEKDGPVFKMKDDPRVTRVGKILRKTSLDELPQFFNSLKGDISVVGPRPALPCEASEYDEHQEKRLSIRPGITCFWQTSKDRDSITFDEWVDLDLCYIKRCGVWTDIKLIFKTVAVVISAQGN